MSFVSVCFPVNGSCAYDIKLIIRTSKLCDIDALNIPYIYKYNGSGHDLIYYI